MIQNAKIGNPEMRGLDMEGEYPPVIDEMDEGQKSLGGGTSQLMVDMSLSMEKRDYSERESGIIMRLPEGSKRMLGIR